MQELLELVKKGASHTKAFTTSRHLAYVQDWKKFITPYLFTRLDALTGISTKQHYFKFYLKDNKPYVQTKDYARDLVWGPPDGNQCLLEVSEKDSKPKFAEIEDANK